MLNTNLAATLHSPHKSRECGLSSRSDDGCLHDAYWGDAAGQHWQVCASWLLLRLFPSAHSLARSGCRLSHFTDHISQCCSHQQSIHPHKHLPRRSLPLIVAEALQLKFEIDQRNQWPATRSTFNSSQRPLALSELPCFTHRASQTPGDTDVVEPRCLRDHCFRSYVRLSAGSTGGRLRALKTSRTFQPSGFSLWLAVASAYNDDG